MRSAFSAAWPIGTMRSFDPLPRARRTPSSMSTSISSRPIASEARRPQAYISSSRARSRRADGLGAARLREQLLHLAPREHLGQLPRAPRRAQRRGGIALEQAVAAQVPVEGAQAGALAVDGRGRRGRPAVAVAPGQRLEEVGDVARLRLQRGHVALLQEAAELEQVGAVRVERVAGQPALELEVGEEVEHEVLEPALGDRLLDCGHVRVFGRPGVIPCRCNASVSGSGTRAARGGR